MASWPRAGDSSSTSEGNYLEQAAGIFLSIFIFQQYVLAVVNDYVPGVPSGLGESNLQCSWGGCRGVDVRQDRRPPSLSAGMRPGCRDPLQGHPGRGPPVVPDATGKVRASMRGRTRSYFPRASCTPPDAAL